MDSFSHIPPGFRFHPTEEELIDYYLRKKLTSLRIEFEVIKDIDLYKMEPWDLQEQCKIGMEEQNEWYFFSHKDKKYPTGTRTNRATTAGFWKATGRDKAIYSKHSLIGMRKTLVFYRGRAPNGQKSDWIMHEYRLETNENATSQEEGWVVCKVFKKRMNTIQKVIGHGSPCWYEEQLSFMPEIHSPRRRNDLEMEYNQSFPCNQELDLPHPLQGIHTFSNSIETVNCNTLGFLGVNISQARTLPDHMQQIHQTEMNFLYDNNHNVTSHVDDEVTDWRVLDKFVASQLSENDSLKDRNPSEIVKNASDVSEHAILLTKEEIPEFQIQNPYTTLVYTSINSTAKSNH